MIEIALCTDSHYMKACAPCLVSIFEHHKYTHCHVNIVTKSLSRSDIIGINSIAKQYGQSVSILNVNKEVFKNLKVDDRFRESIYYRFLLPNLLPNLDKIIYLDCDIILNGSLDELWSIDISGFACGAVEDQESDDITLHNRIDEYSQIYFNSGVLLLNLSYWRKYDILQKLVEYIYVNAETIYFPDQDALNVVLKGKIKPLSYKFNYQDLWYGKDLQWLRLHKDKFEEVLKWRNSPVVVHFAGDNKPWKSRCRHPFAQYYLECLQKTPWKSSFFKTITNNSPIIHDKRHKYIRRFNRLLVVFIIETLVIILYVIQLLIN